MTDSKTLLAREPKKDNYAGYLHAQDFTEPAIAAEIARVEYAVPFGKPRFVVYFSYLDKPLVLNVTNERSMVALYGTDSKGWIGKEIVLYKTETQWNDETVRCIRIKAPQGYVCPFQPRTFEQVSDGE